jgi:glycosyltransferase involved in cell wall biosynthesis
MVVIAKKIDNQSERMRILIIHNRYKEAGGEDAVFAEEAKLLFTKENIVDSIEFDNKEIRTGRQRLLTGLGILYNFKSASILEEKLLSFYPDIIHIHNFMVAASPSLFYVARKFGIPVVVTLHNYRLICPTGTLFFDGKIYEKSIKRLFPTHSILNRVYRNSFIETAAIAFSMSLHNVIGTWRDRVAKFIVLTEFARQKFSDSALRVTKDQMVVKSNFVCDGGYGQTSREDFFLFVGRLSEEKGIRVLLKSATQFHFNLVMIGEGPLRELVMDYTRLFANITYLGHLGKPSVLNHMKRCKALIFPSIWYEGFPITILEAFSTGTPVIASDIGGLSEIVEENINGLLFEPGNENELTERIMFLCNDTAASVQLGTNARKTYELKYTAEINYNNLMAIYRSVLHETLNKKGSAKNKKISIDSEPRTNPKVSIGIPTFKGEKRILRALESVFIQDYKNVEIIISDNCSDDNTEELIHALNIRHPEIRFFRQTNNIGIIPNFAFTQAQATGKYFMWLADDDALEPGCIKKYVRFMEANPDYALTSGQIYYWKGIELDYIEKGFTLRNRLSVVRALQYYNRVIYGGMFHGLMRKETAERISSRNTFANDFHFVTSLAYLGKIMNFDYPGYHKHLGGFSENVKTCAAKLGASAFLSRHPHIKVSLDAYSEIMEQDSVYQKLAFYQRLPFAVMCSVSSFLGYYGRVFPMTIAGKIKRFVLGAIGIPDSGSIFKRRSMSIHN